MNGKTIRLYLVNGSPTDILTAEIINWTGKIIVAPRAQLAELAIREEVRRTGVYGVRQRICESIPPLGTRGEQVACFPSAQDSQPWHGYPIWPLEVRQDGDRLRPIASSVLALMVEKQVITEKEKRRLGKGKHI